MYIITRKQLDKLDKKRKEGHKLIENNATKEYNTTR